MHVLRSLLLVPLLAIFARATVEVSATAAPDYLELVTTRAEEDLDYAPQIFLRLQVGLQP